MFLSVPIRVNGRLPESRLMRSTAAYVRASLVTMMRIHFLYRQFRVFARLSVLPLASGNALRVRWLILNGFVHPITGRLQIPSLIVAVLLLAIEVALLLAGVLAELLAANRKLLEELRYNQRVQRFAKPSV